MLEEDDPTVLAMFLTWLIKGSVEYAAEFLEVPGTTTDETPESVIEQSASQIFQLVRSYGFGDLMQAELCRNHIMDVLVMKQLEL